MLVLGRLIGEEIIMILPDGRQGRIVAIDTWQGVSPRRMKIGFDFPTDVKIIRKELMLKDKPEEDIVDKLEDRHE